MHSLQVKNSRLRCVVSQLRSRTLYIATLKPDPRTPPAQVPFNRVLMALNRGYSGYIRGYLGGLGKLQFPKCSGPGTRAGHQGRWGTRSPLCISLISDDFRPMVLGSGSGGGGRSSSSSSSSSGGSSSTPTTTPPTNTTTTTTTSTTPPTYLPTDLLRQPPLLSLPTAIITTATAASTRLAVQRVGVAEIGVLDVLDHNVHRGCSQLPIV